MSEYAIKVEGLGKEYKIGRKKATSLRDIFNHRGGGFDSFWALKDVSFEVAKGEAVGIIGRNGAGKSTLLKILSRITWPTKGRFEINGRVASLLEVGTGFHPELTGRENIFLNGTILGMARAEIKMKFDEIVEFSGVEKFIDTPVKHYSSGMKVRLAFAVAAHLDPEILIVDEVLAVGDVEFQKKCLGKMDEVSKKEGRTVFFVSHNLGAVGNLCTKGVLLANGKLLQIGRVSEVTQKFISINRAVNSVGQLINLDFRKGNGFFRVNRISILNDQFQYCPLIRTGERALFEVSFSRNISNEKGGFRIDFAIDAENDSRIGWFSSDATSNLIGSTFDKIYLDVPRFRYGPGNYYLTFYCTWYGEVVDYIHQGFFFEVEEGDFFGTGKHIPRSQTFFYNEHQIFSR